MKLLSDNRFPHPILETPDIHHAPVKRHNQANAQVLGLSLRLFS